jgi:hypothetical protein
LPKGKKDPLYSIQSGNKVAYLLYIKVVQNSYLCNQLGNALFCVTSGIFAGRAQRDPAKSHELHKITHFLMCYIQDFF